MLKCLYKGQIWLDHSLIFSPSPSLLEGLSLSLSLSLCLSLSPSLILFGFLSFSCLGDLLSSLLPLLAPFRPLSQTVVSRFAPVSNLPPSLPLSSLPSSLHPSIALLICLIEEVITENSLNTKNIWEDWCRNDEELTCKLGALCEMPRQDYMFASQSRTYTQMHLHTHTHLQTPPLTSSKYFPQ